MKYSDNFLKEMKRLGGEEITDFDDAIAYAMDNVPLIDDMTWFGELGQGVYYANSRESRWFPELTASEVAYVLAKEML